MSAFNFASMIALTNVNLSEQLTWFQPSRKKIATRSSFSSNIKIACIDLYAFH